MKYISTKQLRQVFPEVRAALAQGEEYVLIHRSQPIAKLVPLEEKEEPSARKSSSKVQTHEPAAADQTHVTSHVLHKPMTLPTPAGYSHPVAFRHLKLDLKETVNLIKPKQ